MAKPKVQKLGTFFVSKVEKKETKTEGDEKKGWTYTFSEANDGDKKITFKSPDEIPELMTGMRDLEISIKNVQTKIEDH